MGRNAREYAKKNPEAVRLATAKYHLNNKEKVRLRNRQWRRDNPEKEAAAQRNWYKNNKEEVAKKGKFRREHDICFRFSDAIRTSVGHSLGKGGMQGMNVWEILGYTYDSLVAHFEKLFASGMYWGNYGEWQVDHIMPKSFFVFNSSGDVEFKMCWRLENLQPLWKIDNLRKQTKIIFRSEIIDQTS